MMIEERLHQYSPVCATPTAKKNLYVQALDYRDNLKTKEDLEIKIGTMYKSLLIVCQQLKSLR